MAKNTHRQNLSSTRRIDINEELNNKYDTYAIRDLKFLLTNQKLSDADRDLITKAINKKTK